MLSSIIGTLSKESVLFVINLYLMFYNWIKIYLFKNNFEPRFKTPWFKYNCIQTCNLPCSFFASPSTMLCIHLVICCSLRIVLCGWMPQSVMLICCCCCCVFSYIVIVVVYSLLHYITFPVYDTYDVCLIQHKTWPPVYIFMNVHIYKTLPG